MTDKLYLDAETLNQDAFRLGLQVIQSGFRPNRMLALWRGGAPIGIAVQEIMAYVGIHTDHIAIRTSAYTARIDQRHKSIRLHGLDYLYKRIESTDRLLIVDDVFDTGLSVQAVIQDIQRQTRANTPAAIRIAVAYYKPQRNLSDLTPDYFVHTTDRWLKFPHSLEGLSEQEIKTHRPELYAIVGAPKPATDDSSTA